MIKKIVTEINRLGLTELTANFGYSDTKANGIFVSDIITKDITKHNKGERLQILICITDIEDGYLKIKEIADKVKNKLDELNCYDISMHYIGEYQNKHSYSINLSAGGIKW